MKHGDFYTHFKGGEYYFDCIALPIQDSTLSNREKVDMLHTHEAKYHDGAKSINLYESGGATFIDSDVPHVIYQAEKDYNTDYLYAREVDDFFGYKEKDGQLIKRFTLKERE